MEVYNSTDKIQGKTRDCVLVIGNFDGVHKGHQQIIATAKSIADKHKKRLVLLTFEPHPRKLFRPNDPPFRITPFAVKSERLEKSGIDTLISLDFDWDFASLSPEDFIKTIIHDAIAPSHVIVGYDFHFGQMRKGTPETLEGYSAQYKYDLQIINQITNAKDEVFSSSSIRTALRHGKIDTANDILGWPWEIRGKIFVGNQRGRELGYPTANVALEETLHPGYGVYASWAQIEGETIWRPSATNIGIRPMFEIPTGQVETYIFDFDDDIYHKTLRVKPVERLRGEAKFDSLEELIDQIDQDCVQSKAVLDKHGSYTEQKVS